MGAALDKQAKEAIPQPRPRSGGGPKAPHVRRDLAGSVEAVCAELARVYKDARQGRISTSDGYRLSLILNGLGRLLETAEIERRLEQLEQSMGTVN